MSGHDHIQTRSSRFTASPASQRSAPRAVETEDDIRVPAHDRAARDQIAGIDAQSQAIRLGADQDLHISSYAESSHPPRANRERGKAVPSREEPPALGTHAHHAKHADSIGAEMVDRAFADKGFRSQVAAAQIHQELRNNPSAAVVAHLPEDRASARGQIRDQVDRLYKGQSAQSMGRFVRVFEEQEGKRVDVEPPKAIAQDREKLVDWIADQAVAGKGLSMRSREMATVASIATSLTEDRAGVHFARQGMEPKHVELSSGIEQSRQELLGLNGAQNKAVQQGGKLISGDRAVGQSDLLERLRSFGDRLDAERPGDIAPDSTFGQFMAAARGKVQEAEIGLFSDVVYPNGRQAVTLEIPVPKPAVQVVGDQPVTPDTKEVTIEVQGKSAPVAAKPSAAERADVAPQSAADATKSDLAIVDPLAGELVSRPRSQDNGIASQSDTAIRHLQGLPRDVTHLGRIETTEALVEVMSMANKSRLSGRLDLVGENQAKVWFAGGEISDVRMEGSKGESPAESLAYGRFDGYAFHAGDVKNQSAAKVNFTSVVMEMARLQDDRQRATVDARRGSTAELMAQAEAEATRGGTVEA